MIDLTEYYVISTTCNFIWKKMCKIFLVVFYMYINFFKFLFFIKSIYRYCFRGCNFTWKKLCKIFLCVCCMYNIFSILYVSSKSIHRYCFRVFIKILIFPVKFFMNIFISTLTRIFSNFPPFCKLKFIIIVYFLYTKIIFFLYILIYFNFVYIITFLHFYTFSEI